jgi:hypothetical protein
VILDVARGVALADEFGTSAPDEVCMVADSPDAPDLARVEHLLHEAIHALSLSMSPHFGMEVATSHLLVAFTDQGLWEEAKVLACETLLFERLGQPLDMADVRDTANIQGVDSEMLDCALGSPEAVALLDRVIAWGVEVQLLRGVELSEAASSL